MTYPMMNGTLISTDLGQMFVYVNSITGGMAVPFMMLAFFLVVLFASLIMQMRFSGRIKPEVSLAAASFASLGFVLISLSIEGIDLSIYLWLNILVCILSAMWLLLSDNP